MVLSILSPMIPLMNSPYLVILMTYGHDSEAAMHITFHREWISNFRECNGDKVKLGEDSLHEIKYRGTIKIKRYINNTWKKGELEDVLYVPTLR